MGDAASFYGALVSHQNEFFILILFFFLKLSVTLSAFSTTPLLFCHNSSWQLCAFFWAKLRYSLGHMQHHPWSSKRRDPDVEEEEQESFVGPREKKWHTILYVNIQRTPTIIGEEVSEWLSCPPQMLLASVLCSKLPWQCYGNVPTATSSLSRFLVHQWGSNH